MDILQISVGPPNTGQTATAWIKPASAGLSPNLAGPSRAAIPVLPPPDPGQKAAIGQSLLESRTDRAFDLPDLLRQIEVTLKPYDIRMLPPNRDARPANPAPP